MQRIFTISLIWLLISTGISLANNPTISFASDTIHACLGEVFEVDPAVSGGTAPYQYNWSTGDVDSILALVPTQSFTSLELIVTDAQGNADTAKLVIHALDECVYPGDANGDGAANHVDILNLGISYGQTGYVRPNAHLNWIGQPSHSWTQNFGSGVNYAHSDGDGNGVIDAGDILAIEHNYLAPNPYPGSISLSGIPISVEFDALNAQPGDTVRARIMLGSPSQTADSIYGVAFSLELEGYEIDSGSVQVMYDGSVLGNSTDILTVDKAFYDRKRIEVGISRFDGNQLNAVRGQMAEIIVVIDEIIGKRQGVEILDFNLSSVTIKNAQGDFLPANPSGSALNIITSTDEFSPYLDLGVRQLPGKGWLITMNANNPGIQKASLVNLDGRKVFETKVQDESFFVPSFSLARGVYVLMLEGEKATYPIKLPNY